MSGVLPCARLGIDDQEERDRLGVAAVTCITCGREYPVQWTSSLCEHCDSSIVAVLVDGGVMDLQALRGRVSTSG